MVVLTEKIVLGRARTTDLSGVKTLNCWGSDLTDVSVVKSLPNVEVINASVNDIASLDAFSTCLNLKELYLRKNKIKNIEELSHLMELKNLRFLWLSGNPFCDSMSTEDYRLAVIKSLPQIQKLDNTAVTSSEIQKALQLNLENAENETDENAEVSSVHSESCEISKDSSEITLVSGETKSQDNFTAESATSSQTLGTEPSSNVAIGDHDEPANQESAAAMTLEETNQLRSQLGLNPIPVAKYNASVTPHFKPPRRLRKHCSTKGNNILSATMSLIQELDTDSLLSLQDAIQERLEVLIIHRPTEVPQEQELLPS